MAIACSEILKQNAETKKWTTGREWYDSYENITFDNQKQIEPIYKDWSGV